MLFSDAANALPERAQHAAPLHCISRTSISSTGINVKRLIKFTKRFMGLLISMRSCSYRGVALIIEKFATILRSELGICWCSTLNMATGLRSSVLFWERRCRWSRFRTLTSAPTDTSVADPDLTNSLQQIDEVEAQA